VDIGKWPALARVKEVMPPRLCGDVVFYGIITLVRVTVKHRGALARG
jgi:hypothetical protein